MNMLVSVAKRDWEKRMKDVEINELLEIPLQTMQKWKKAKDWRFLVYNYFHRIDRLEIEDEIKKIKKIRDMKIKKEASGEK